MKFYLTHLSEHQIFLRQWMIYEGDMVMEAANNDREMLESMKNWDFAASLKQA